MSLGRSGLRAMVRCGLAALMVVALGAASASAEPSTYCVKATKVLTPKKHFTGGFNDKGCTSVNATHEGKFDKLASFTAPEEAQLKALLKYVNVQSSGVGGKPTVQFSGANVQVVNGAGTTASTNGEGNLVIGYDENPGSVRGKQGVQTGSHNLILGYEQEFTSYGGLVAGFLSSITDPFASVSGGYKNTARGENASIGGGGYNTANGRYASVSGGLGNTVGSYGSSISGGRESTIEGIEADWIGGGLRNTVTGSSARYSAIFGGKENTTSASEASIP